MIHVALWEPEIPPNTGNIARLCAAVDARLHLIGRLGFSLDNRRLLRAGCDYWPSVDVHRHTDWEQFRSAIAPSRIIALSSHATASYTRVQYVEGDCLLFGNESSGLPPSLHAELAANACTIPMPTGNVRCLNLATAVGIVLYEALRQLRNW